MPNYSGLFRVDDSFALSLVTAFLAVNGTEALEWEPDTLRLEIQDDFGVDPSQTVMDKLQAGITLMTTDHFYTYWEPFEEIVHVLNDYQADFTVMRPPTPEEMGWAVVEAYLIDQESETGSPMSGLFTPEVKAYVAAILHKQGYYKSPETLQFIDMSILHPNPEKDHPELEDDIRDMHEIKLLRVQMHVADQHRKLNQELQQYFGKGIPDLKNLFEQGISWR